MLSEIDDCSVGQTEYVATYIIVTVAHDGYAERSRERLSTELSFAVIPCAGFVAHHRDAVFDGLPDWKVRLGAMRRVGADLGVCEEEVDCEVTKKRIGVDPKILQALEMVAESGRAAADQGATVGESSACEEQRK